MLAQHRAPAGKYRVLGVDKFSHEDWIEGDYDSFAEAEAVALAQRADALKRASDAEIADVYYVYNDRGEYLGTGRGVTR